MTRSSIHGVPRIGPDRELKRALERHWAGEEPIATVHSTARRIRARWWTLMRDAGIDLIPSNDFSLYDHVLDTISMVGAVPPRFGHRGGPVELETYFAMARGRSEGTMTAPAMEMTKWFDTNYHHIVPELDRSTRFELSSTKPIDEFAEAHALGIVTKPALLGPVTFLLLARPAAESGFDPLTLLDPLLDVYADLLERLAAQGAEWVQLDESAFVQDRLPKDLSALRTAYRRLAPIGRRPRLLVSTSFGHTAAALPVIVDLPVEGVGLDLTRGGSEVERLRQLGGLGDRLLVAGVVDGRGVWVNDLVTSLRLLRSLSGLAEEIAVSTSCSLLHVPDDISRESALDPEIRSQLAFARQKVDEVALLARGLSHGGDAIAEALEDSRRLLDARRSAPRTGDPAVGRHLAEVLAESAPRRAPYEIRAARQRERLLLPPLPTTTIGSFPQTHAIRAARADLHRGRITEAEYRRRIRAEIQRAVQMQEDIGLDVLVHGEPERSDMVEYFAERMHGFAVTEHGWVQSYGTRCARPPIIVGDISRPAPITVEWTTFAQSLTRRPVKGMLTGPVTMLLWSYPRDDLDLAHTCAQLALAIRDEVSDLEAAGVGIIQVDEPAFREGLPLREEERGAYLEWAVRCFRLATAGAADATQVHTHMCYADFGDILPAINALDADVISLEAARSRMEVTGELAEYGYQRQVGPGVYDVHSPRVPTPTELAERIRAAAASLPPAQLWINPDCGLKTRSYDEVEPSLRAMVEAALQVRTELASQPMPGERGSMESPQDPPA